MRRFAAAVVIASLLWVPSLMQTATAIYCYAGDPPAVYQACLAYNQGIGQQLFGYASAIGVLLFAVIFILSLAQLRVFRGFGSD
jgi:ABC-type sugar transport system permease subunit